MCRTTRIIISLLLQALTSYMTKRAPAEYMENLTPKYCKWFEHCLRMPNMRCQSIIVAPGCRRLIADSDYLSALHRPNLTQNWDKIEGIAENGIVTSKGNLCSWHTFSTYRSNACVGHIPFDIIITATGFVTASHLRHDLRAHIFIK